MRREYPLGIRIRLSGNMKGSAVIVTRRLSMVDQAAHDPSKTTLAHCPSAHTEGGKACHPYPLVVSNLPFLLLRSRSQQ